MIPYKKQMNGRMPGDRDGHESELRFQGKGISAGSPAAFPPSPTMRD